MKKIKKRRLRRKIFRLIFTMILLIALVVMIAKLREFIKSDERTQIKWNLFKVQQGRITIRSLDSDTELPIKNNKYSITKLESGELVEIISTDINGEAISGLLDYDYEYEIKCIESNPYYQINKEDVSILEVNEENHELIIRNKMYEHIKQVKYSEDGDIIVEEVYVDVPTIMQLPELPNGCEITSLTAVLNYLGYNVEKTEMADIHLPKESFYSKDGKLYGANPYVAYAGNPREKNAFFSYAPPIVKAANNYLNTVENKLNPIDISGSTREEIIEYLNQGIPVVIWVTLDLNKPIRTYSWYLSDTGVKTDMPINLHCVVINGYVGNNIYVMNPLKGQVTYNADTFFKSYEELGSHAMIVK